VCCFFLGDNDDRISLAVAVCIVLANESSVNKELTKHHLHSALTMHLVYQPDEKFSHADKQAACFCNGVWSDDILDGL
jgi:hypothetical protein